MVFECKRLHRHVKLLLYLVCLLMLFSAIMVGSLPNSIYTPAIAQFVLIIVFLFLTIIILFEANRNLKLKVIKIEILPDKIIIYVNRPIGYKGFERIQLDIDTCQFKETYRNKVGILLLINDGFSTYKLFRNAYREEDYQLIRDSLIKESPLELTQEYKLTTTICPCGALFLLVITFWPNPSIFTYLNLILYPMLTLLPIKLILNKFNVKNRTTFNNIILAFLVLPCLFLIKCILRDWNLIRISWSEFWIPFYIISVIYLVPIIIFVYRTKISEALIVLALVLCFIYSSQATIAINCLFDPSTPLVYKTTIINKKIRTYKAGIYHLMKVTACGPFEKETDVKVKKEIYQKFNPNDEAQLFIGKGLFSISWYYIGGEGST